MLAAYLDAVGGYRTEGARMEAYCELQSLRIESQVVLNNESVEQSITGQVRPPSIRALAPPSICA